MKMNGSGTRLMTIGIVAMLALGIVPLLASTASAATVGPATGATASRSAEWAYGGEGWNAGGLSIGRANLTWNSSAGVDVVYNLTNTSSTTMELTVTRTVAVTITATYKGPLATWTYHFKATENDLAYVNLTNASTVVLANASKVAALGILNASLHANATVAASLVGSTVNKTVSDYLNASGWADAKVSFTPSLGVVPLNLTGVTSWNSTANASGSAAWNVSWSFVNHGWNGSTLSKTGDFNGTWSAETPVTLTGHLGGTYARWVDHRLRTAIGLRLAGPFDLYAGFVLIPHHFDLFNGAGSAYAASGLGTSSVTSEYLYLNGGKVGAGSVTASNLSTGSTTPTPATFVPSGSGATPATLVPAAGAPGVTVWAGPESPSAARSQAACLEFGCAGSSSPLGRLVLPLAIVGVAAVVAIGLILVTRSRGRGGRPTDTPRIPAAAFGPTPSTGPGPNDLGRPPA